MNDVVIEVEDLSKLYNLGTIVRAHCEETCRNGGQHLF
jgi:hypothetical protein